MPETVAADKAAAIERACTRLVLDAVAANDGGDFEAFAALFTPDGILRRPSGEPLHGREAIAASYGTRPASRITRHVVSNVRIDVESSAAARGLSYVVLYAADGDAAPDRHFGVPADPRTLVGEFEDRFVLTGEGWRIAERDARFVMHAE